MTIPPGPWKLKNPREPKVQVGVGIKQTTICTEPTPEEYIKVRWISASHETRSNRRELCGVERKRRQEERTLAFISQSLSQALDAHSRIQQTICCFRFCLGR